MTDEPEADPPRRVRTLIAIATRERPAGLRSLLESLDRCQIPPSADVECLVVDNDLAGSAASTVEGISIQMPIRYLHEPRVGIPFARNAALDAAADHDFLVFVDDDETVEEDWLVELHRVITMYGADAATGPVRKVVPDGTRQWIRECGFFDQPAIVDGTIRKSARTSNVIIRVSALLERGLRFDETFPLLGGTDSWLFEQLHQQGGTLVWAEHANVREITPATRTTAPWLIRRNFRIGLASTRRRRLAEPGPRRVAIETLRGCYRLGDAGRLLIVGQGGIRTRSFRVVLRAAEAVGTFAGIIGLTIRDYATVD